MLAVIFTDTKRNSHEHDFAPPSTKKSIWPNLLKIAFAVTVVVLLADMRSSINGSENGIGMIKNAHAQKVQKKEVVICDNSRNGSYWSARNDVHHGELTCSSTDPAIKGGDKKYNLKELYMMGWRVTQYVPVYYGLNGEYYYNNYILEK